MQLPSYLLLLIVFFPVSIASAQEKKPRPEFHILSADGQDTLFAAKHVYLHYSPDSSQVSIQHEAVYKLIFRLPYHGLKADHLEAVWDKESDMVFFHASDMHNRFYFTDPDKRKLELSSSNGVLDLEEKALQLKNVPAIHAGNAMIIPKDHTVVIRQDGLPPIPQAHIILNAFTRHHQFLCDKVQVKSRKEFVHGENLAYTYYHAPTRKTYQFEEVTIASEEVKEDFKVAFETTITLSIKPEDRFELFEGYYFKGEATAKDWEKEFQFRGHIGKKPDSASGTIEWTPYEGKEQLGRF